MKNEKGGKQMEKVKCEHCGYIWVTNSEKMFVTCPNCMKKTKVISALEQ